MRYPESSFFGSPGIDALVNRSTAI